MLSRFGFFNKAKKSTNPKASKSSMKDQGNQVKFTSKQSGDGQGSSGDRRTQSGRSAVSSSTKSTNFLNSSDNESEEEVASPSKKVKDFGSSGSPSSKESKDRRKDSESDEEGISKSKNGGKNGDKGKKEDEIRSARKSRDRESTRNKERKREQDRHGEKEEVKSGELQVADEDVHPNAALIRQGSIQKMGSSAASPTSAAVKQPLKSKQEESSSGATEANRPVVNAKSGVADRGPPHPMVAAMNARNQTSPTSGSNVPLGPPFGLRPVFNPGDFEKKRQNMQKVADAKAPSSAVNDPSMDTVRQQAINDAKRCSKEATEIYPFLRVSGDWVARNKELLLESGVTHILNMAHTVCKNYHEDCKEFEYLALDVIDSASESITPFLLEAVDFIEKARRANGCCYVHCHMGVSRSCTVVIAYVMLKDKIPFQKAFDLVKGKRPVCNPNAGFIAQLQMWGKTLTEMPTRGHLYRVARHSVKDPSLVIKLCCEEDCKTPVNANPTEMDARGVFLLHDYTKRRFYVWVGPRCADVGAFLDAAEKFGGWKIQYLPSFRRHKMVYLKDGTKEDLVAFWSNLGVQAADAAEMTDADVDQDLSKYNEEYKSVQNSEPGRSAATASHRMSRPSPLLSPARSVTSDKDSIFSSPKSSKSEKLKVQLYTWVDEQDSDLDIEEVETNQPNYEWDRIRDYDADELVSESMFVLLVHDRELALRKGQSRRTIHRAYLWLGSNLEGKINEQASVSKGSLFVDYCCQRTKSPKVEPLIEHDEKESSSFWEAFESGF